MGGSKILMGKATDKLEDLMKNSKVGEKVIIGKDKEGNDIIFIKR